MKPVDIPKALSLLDQELAKKKVQAELTICGGAALILMGVVSRGTSDVDVVAKKIPDAVLAAAKVVAKKLKCREDWLNNRVNPIIERLPVNWEDHLVTLFTGKAVTVKSISRQDLICAKLHAAVDRKGLDFSDVIDLKPTAAEIEVARQYCLKQAQTETYEVWVNGYVNLLKKDLGVA
ncbi:MAG TPA: DUF6036 family nucleotidyltransferase [Bdellovibrionota bacterium]|nr:DUF6036 family nucleotidyltransferase [Bdellovibrionota bacterium]